MTAALIMPMQVDDLPQVMDIERQSFPTPWSMDSYRYELTQNQTAHFLVALDPAQPQRPDVRSTRRVLGYGGFWLVTDQAHIGTMAVHPRWRGRGIGERLLVTMLQQARELGAGEALLEVRAGNQLAQKLYRKYQFEEVGRRPHYYRDNQEDAVLMTAKL